MPGQATYLDVESIYAGPILSYLEAQGSETRLSWTAKLGQVTAPKAQRLLSYVLLGSRKRRLLLAPGRRFQVITGLWHEAHMAMVRIQETRPAVGALLHLMPL